MRSYLTKRQIEVLKLLAQGFSVDEVARILGTSKSNVYYLLRAAKEAIERSKNTLRMYNEIFNSDGNYVVIHANTPLNRVLSSLISKADESGIKVRLTSAELLLKLLKLIKMWNPTCLDIDNLLIRCETILRIDENDVNVVDVISPV